MEESTGHIHFLTRSFHARDMRSSRRKDEWRFDYSIKNLTALRKKGLGGNSGPSISPEGDKESSKSCPLCNERKSLEGRIWDV